ncbi:MAG: transglycosylase SLT domain-containing protein, partial [Ktedonobacteraceae bacterium]|nr:transglycosylase SLT domain-containing protein [Ktedonobacteraceae bacterium]
TLSAIARRYHTSVGALARANAIHRPGLIISGKRLCIPRLGYHDQVGHSGLHRNGTVKWFAYSALQQSTRPQVEKLLRRAAARHHLPAGLVLAIAWQESGWNQHIIGRDGGIGVMQLMPYTARGLNIQVRGRHDPYKLSGNIELGVVYLHTLWTNFHGNTTKVISAYNEGGWNVVHRGIYNWRYVNNVRALMRRFH